MTARLAVLDGHDHEAPAQVVAPVVAASWAPDAASASAHALVVGADDEHGEPSRRVAVVVPGMAGAVLDDRVAWPQVDSTPSSSSNHTSPSSTTSKSMVASCASPAHRAPCSRQARQRRLELGDGGAGSGRRLGSARARAGPRNAEAKTADGWEVRVVLRLGAVAGKGRRRVAAPQAVELRARRERRTQPVDLRVAGDDRLAVSVVAGHHSSYVHRPIVRTDVDGVSTGSSRPPRRWRRGGGTGGVRGWGGRERARSRRTPGCRAGDPARRGSIPR